MLAASQTISKLSRNAVIASSSKAGAPLISSTLFIDISIPARVIAFTVAKSLEANATSAFIKCDHEDKKIGVIPFPPKPSPMILGTKVPSSKAPPAGYTPRSVLVNPSGGIPLSFPWSRPQYPSGRAQNVIPAG